MLFGLLLRPPSRGGTVGSRRHVLWTSPLARFKVERGRRPTFKIERFSPADFQNGSKLVFWMLEFWMLEFWSAKERIVKIGKHLCKNMCKKNVRNQPRNHHKRTLHASELRTHQSSPRKDEIEAVLWLFCFHQNYRLAESAPKPS